MFYRRRELARRLAIFYAASNIANAFSGLLAFGTFQIVSSLPSWRYLFIIEGAASVLCTHNDFELRPSTSPSRADSVLVSTFAFFYLPASAATARFLSPAEQTLAYNRIRTDSSAIVNEPFNLRSALTVFTIPVAYVWIAIDICVGVPLQSVSLFLPQIVARLGYSTVKTNLYTVAPSISGAIVLLILAFSSDAAGIRFPFIALGFLLTCIGFLIYATVDVAAQLHVAYFATFMMTWGTSAPSVLLSTWYNNNIAHEGRRVTLTAVGVPLANLMGVVSSNIFLNRDAPKYLPALATTAAFGLVGSTLAVLLGIYMFWDNRRRDGKQGIKMKARDVPTSKLRDGPKEEDFRWYL